VRATTLADTEREHVMLTCRVVDDAGHAVPGVAVSDGHAVVTTDADGRARLARAEGSFVWISRPDGFDTSSWFHRLGVETSADVEPDVGPDVQFVVERVEQPLPFTFAQITDLHLSDAAEPVTLPLADSPYGLDASGAVVTRPLTSVDHLTAVLAEVACAHGPHGPARFAVATGDLTDHGTSSEFAMLALARSASPLPVHVLPGNHDHYGHLHEPRDDDAPVDSHGMGTGTTSRYDEHVGPRWWSLTHAGLRLVALDWFSHRLGLDRDVQEEWLAADLATAPAGTPVLFLTHDQMSSEFFDRVTTTAPHVRIVGSLSGHWHTSRVVRIDGQVHANTGNATFGSFDWAPAHARLFGWDGHELTARTVALGAGEALTTSTFAASGGALPELPTAQWVVRLPGAVHLARPATTDAGAVVVAWSDDDTARGGLSCHDMLTGEERWRVALDAPVRAGVTWIAETGGPGVVVAVSISGGVTAVAADTGARRWSVQLGDPMLAWVHAAPVPLGRAVAAGEIRSYAALDLADGSVRWRRDRRHGVENTATSTQGVLQDGTLVAAFSMMAEHTMGLDPVTGEVRWTRDGTPHHSAASDLVPDPGGRDVYVTRLGGRVERFAAATGEVRWATKVGAAFAPGRPLVVDAAVIVTTALGAVHRFDAATGAEVWRNDLPGGEPDLAMGPYRRSGAVVPAGPELVGDALVQVGGDGRVHRIDLDSGHAIEVAATGVPITVPAVACDRDAIVATAEGTLARLDVSG
jgi:outer membrane protein assembly factor BamB